MFQSECVLLRYRRNYKVDEKAMQDMFNRNLSLMATDKEHS